MAADRRFFPAAARVHPVHQTPHVALLVTSLWSALLTLSGGYEALFTYVTFASVLFGVLGGMATADELHEAGAVAVLDDLGHVLPLLARA